MTSTNRRAKVAPATTGTGSLSAGTSGPAAPALPGRVESLDVYRGFVMLLMMAEVLRLGAVAKAFPDSGLWQFLAWQQSHVPWRGGTLHDMIQPSFSFLVGAALPFSLAARAARGQSSGTMTLHALWRAAILVFLGIFLRSVGKPMTNFTFEDTLTQIGLGYVFLFALGLAGSMRAAWTAFGAILAGTWAAFVLWPGPGPGFDPAKVGVSAAWLEAHGLSGFAAHWQKNANPAWAFDTWWLNLFPREIGRAHV